jgi:phosphoesterase RecJ-like protein
MDKIRAQMAWDKVMAAKHVLIVNDVRIDGDTVGSSLGFGNMICEVCNVVSHFSPEPIPDSYSFLPGVNLITTDEAVLNDATIDLVVSFDCGDGAHVLDARSKVPGQPFLISFDHHKSNSSYADLNLLLPSASSTAEVVWKFFKLLNVRMNNDCATNLLTGLCTDTEIFSNLATNVDALRAASELSLIGAKVRDVERHLFLNRGLNALRLWGRVLERISRHPEHDVVTTFFTQNDLKELECNETDIEGLMNFLITILIGADTIMLFRETNDCGIKGSMRTLSADVARVGEWFPKGGGHAKAAGLYVPNASMRLNPSGIVEVV